MRKCRKCGKELKLKSWSHALKDFVCLRCLAMSKHIAPVQEYEIKGEDKMQTKHIEKLEDLNNYRWQHCSMNFGLEVKPSMILYIKAYFFNGNEEIERDIMHCFTEKNLTELEFYGLKVVLNEKLKLTREEKEYIEAEWYIARDKDNKLFLYHIHPNRNEEYEEWEPSIGSRACAIDINRTLFPFITWESGKAWSKAELMELEVME